MSSLGDLLKNLSNPAPKEIDPESGDYEYEAQGLLNSENAEREHYINVGPSKIRKNQEIEIDDKKYVGKKSSRKELYDDESNIESESEEDEEINENSEDEDISENEVDEKENEEEENEEESDDDDKDDEEDEENENKISTLNQELKDEFEELEKEEKAIMSNISNSTKSEIEKGKNVKNQLSICDALLDLRIRTQKVVTIANQLPQYNVYPLFSNNKEEDTNNALNNAKESALGFMNELLQLKQDFFKNNDEINTSELNNKKRKRSIDDEDLMEDLWDEICEYNNNFKEYQNKTLEKWNNKIQMTSGIQKKFKAVNQSITSQINQLLSDKDRLIKRTQLKRSEYKSLGKKIESENKNDSDEHVDQHLANYDPEIFDDTDFYQQLLKELIESRMVETDDPIALSMKWATFKALQQKTKKKKVVDTRASKGRKIRYHVHEKIQNFMVPIETATWHDEMTDELFKGLFGRNAEAIEKEKEALNLVKNAENGKITTDDGLRLFG